MSLSFPTPVVEPSWLAEHLHKPTLVVVDCRFSLSEPELGRQQYTEGHIPGAVYLDLNRDLSGSVQRHGGRHPLPDLAKLSAKLGAIGINSKNSMPTQVVAYDSSDFAFAARLWWLLNYLGHDQVAVLNGGFTGWQSAGYGLSQAVSSLNPGNFVPQPHPELMVEIEELKQHKDAPGVWLVDSRSPERYRGEKEPIDPVAGSIPGAVNYFWQAVSDSQGRLRSPIELKQHWQSLSQADQVIVYCGSGVTACVNLLSQVAAGLPMPKLYVGGWSDWCSYR
ncbi:MAG: sulfurtransferase [Leptolyngbyaceae cyanobacterium SM1_1_3]|nr:sulfurtransferase [Leptolyngbyaceae cyanobacterium SM1_1_3]NJN03192.1 sulfurtransferase [Leptolyngbyaceae cyanobacterium RM1_1_2]NJO08889.1 sulfurtransferase [Leptolyngbyaceae cyanobacterium SL_1_1]